MLIRAGVLILLVRVNRGMNAPSRMGNMLRWTQNWDRSLLWERPNENRFVRVDAI